MKNLISVNLLFVIFSCATEAQKTVVDYAASITEEELKTHLYTYASDEFMGREAGTEGETLAINFLNDYYESTGVSGWSTDGSYFQDMTVTDRQGNSIDSYNVLAYIEGTDKSDEVLVITSHLDHIGIEDGLINNGADDDGSGTVAMMEIAEAFIEAKEDGNGPRRSILFLHVFFITVLTYFSRIIFRDILFIERLALCIASNYFVFTAKPIFINFWVISKIMIGISL